MKLEVGKKYRNRKGDIVEIVTKTNDSKFPYVGLEFQPAEVYYTEVGTYYDTGSSLSDLVEEIIKSDPVVGVLPEDSRRSQHEDYQNLSSGQQPTRDHKIKLVTGIQAIQSGKRFRWVGPDGLCTPSEWYTEQTVLEFNIRELRLREFEIEQEPREFFLCISPSHEKYNQVVPIRGSLEILMASEWIKVREVME